jgi:sulfur-oxidizing protein SoxA
MTRKLILAAAAVALVGLAAPGASAADRPWEKKANQVTPQKGNPLPELISGYYFRDKKTQALQDDDFENPGFLWVQRGKALWSKVEGKAGKSCASCHGMAEKAMKGVATGYPKYNPATKKLINLEQRINNCRTKNMKAKAWKWESEPLLSMTTYVRYQSRGMPVHVKVDGKAKPFFEKGKKFYYQRRGQLDMSCANCHETYFGQHIRSDLLSQGQSNGFPTYRLKWQKIGSLHRRFRGCNKNIRAKPYKNGSDEYTNLELYLAWRGQGLKIETPAVRN